MDENQQNHLEVSGCKRKLHSVISVEFDTETEKLTKRQSVLFGTARASSGIQTEQCSAVLVRNIRTTCNGMRVDITAPVNPQTGSTMSLYGSTPAWLSVVTQTGPNRFSLSLAMIVHGHEFPIWLKKTLIDFMGAVAKMKQAVVARSS